MLNLDKPASVNQTLNLDEPTKKRGYQFFLLIFIALLLGAFALKLLVFKNAENKITKFETVPVKRGDLTVTVMATGKLEPVTQVDIGIEVSGTVAEIYADFNDHVTAGQVLAKLDTRLFDSRVKQAQGALDQALAKLVEAQATIAEKKQALSFMQQARQLSGGSVPAKQDIVTAQANLKRAYAQENLIKGSIAQAEGQLKLEQTNLIKASIRTPINGIVLNRKIETGQTVAASLQTPVMFTVAENLTEMELHVDVDEADVGKIKMGQAASFTVDAYPDKNFPAIISQIRYAPETLTGVVTYETILTVNNADLFLRPGMTATAEMVVQKLNNVLLVPTTALRFTPPDKQDKKQEPSFLEKLLPRGPRDMASANKRRGKAKPEKHPPQIWVLDHDKPVAIAVKIGLNDGEMNAVSSEKLHEGMAVIIDTASMPK